MKIREQNERQRSLERIVSIESKISNGTCGDEDNSTLVKQKFCRFEKGYVEQAKGAQVRARIKWVDQGEKHKIFKLRA